MTREGLPNFEYSVGELIEIYGEETAWVSQNDIDRLRSELTSEDFTELSAQLGWEEPEGFNDAA